MTLIAEVFQKISSPKNIYRSLSKKSRFNGYFGKQLSKRTQTLLKFGWQPLYDIYLLLCSQVSYKKFLLVICKISRIFTNTLSADGKYSILKRDNLTQPIQIQVSRKQKTFSEFFSAFLKSNWSFEHFQKKKKNEPHSWCISEITNPKKLVPSMSKKSRFKRSFGKQPGKRAQRLLKFPWQQL